MADDPNLLDDNKREQIVKHYQGIYLTARQIIEKTSESRKRLAKHVRLTSVVQKGPDARNPKRLRRIEAIAQCLREADGTPRLNPPRYHVICVGMDLRERMHQGSVQIACDCADFLYRWNWVLWKKKTAARDYTNKRPPVKTNPNYIPASCKHTIALLQYIISNRL